MKSPKSRFRAWYKEPAIHNNKHVKLCSTRKCQQITWISTTDALMIGHITSILVMWLWWNLGQNYNYLKSQTRSGNGKISLHHLVLFFVLLIIFGYRFTHGTNMAKHQLSGKSHILQSYHTVTKVIQIKDHYLRCNIVTCKQDLKMLPAL